ncbi:MAG: RNA polymerase sigma factor [Opitutaceae bacterium]
MPNESALPSKFATTRWTLVVDAASDSGSKSNEALGELTRCYWQPLYRFARRKGKSVEDAEDLVQGFILHLVQAKTLLHADQAKGRFRTFLLSCFKNWMHNEWRQSTTLKRGGATAALSLDWECAETGLKIDIAGAGSPDQDYDREWAIALLDAVLTKLETSSQQDGTDTQFQELKHCLTADSGKINYESLAQKLDASEGAVRVAVHRLRKRYRALIREEVLRTLHSADALEDEMEALFSALKNN